MSEPRVSIVVPCRNEAASIERLLDSVARQDTCTHEIVVVDNLSSDATPQVVERFARRHPRLRVRLVSCGTIGIPSALNAGIAAAEGDVIVRFDAHSSPAPDYVRRAVGTLVETGAGVVGGVWEIAPATHTAVAEAIARAAAHPMGAGDAAYRVARGTTGLRRVDTVPFGCFRRSLWEELGGFNEHLLTNEDYEFNYRVRRSGRQVVLDPRVRSTYFARASFAGLARQYFRYGWWKAQMLKSHPMSLRWRQAVPPAFVTCLTALAVAALVVPLAWLPFLLLSATYLAALLFASWQVSGGRRPWRIFPVLPAVFAAIHFSWSGGMLVNLLTLGWRPIGSAAAACDSADAIAPAEAAPPADAIDSADA